MCKYLTATARERRWPTKDDEEVYELVCAAFAAASIATLVGLTDEHEPSDAASMRTAQTYCLEWRLVAWATTINTKTGDAPNTDMVVARWDVLRRELPEAIRPPPRSRAWVRLWLTRWGGAYGLAPIGDEPELVDKLAKVIVFLVFATPLPSLIHLPRLLCTPYIERWLCEQMRLHLMAMTSLPVACHAGALFERSCELLRPPGGITCGCCTSPRPTHYRSAATGHTPAR